MQTILNWTEGYALLKRRVQRTIEPICFMPYWRGLTKQEIEEEGLPIPPADYFAETPEEHLSCML